MSELPYGWFSVPIGDICSLKNGRAFKPTEWSKKGLPIVRIQNLNNEDAAYNYYSGEFEDRYYLKGGELLFAWSGTPGTSFGAHVWRGGEAVLNQHIFRVDFDEAKIDKRFFRFAINQKLSELIGIAHGGVGLRHVTKGKFESTNVWLPPYIEQKRIADKLDILLARVDAARERLDRIPTIIKQFRQAVLAAATSGRLTEEWRENNPPENNARDEINAYLNKRRSTEKKTPDEVDLSNWEADVPEGWMLCSVHQFSECLDRLRVPIKRDDRKNTKGLYPYYGANGEVGRIDDYIFDDELVLVTEDETFYGREKPIAYRSSGKCWVNNHAHVLRPEDKKSADYLCYALMYYNVIPWLTGTTGRAKLTQQAMNSLSILVPPKVEMIEIVRRVQAILALADQLEARYQQARAQVDALTPSLLAKAFRGELVEQDPNDEPAEKLLERVRAKAAGKPVGKKATGRGRKAVG
jgi:type I restriction enzyme S subunit